MLMMMIMLMQGMMEMVISTLMMMMQGMMEMMRSTCWWRLHNPVSASLL